MARSCRLTCLKIEGSNLLKQSVDANLTLVSAYDLVLGWTEKLLRVLSGLPSTDLWKKIQNKLTSIFGQKLKIS